MNDLDDLDLSTHLGRLSGPFPDANVAFVEVRRRVKHAQRRRAIGVVGGSTIGILLLAVAFAATLTARDAGSIRPADRPVTVTWPSSTLPGTTLPGTTVPGTTAPAVTAGERQAPPTTEPDPLAPAPERGAEVPQATTTAQDDGTQSDSRGDGAGSDTRSGDAPSSSAHDPGPSTVTFSGIGGTLTVRRDRGGVTLVSAEHRPGYETAVVSARGERVEVRFVADHLETRIEAFQSDGDVRAIVSESDSDDVHDGWDDGRHEGDGGDDGANDDGPGDWSGGSNGR